MNKSDIKTLYDYNYWANQRILVPCANLSTEQLHSKSDFPRGSLMGTLVHCLDAEYGWRMICHHSIVTEDMTEAEFPTLADLINRWREEEYAMRLYLDSLSDASLVDFARYTTPKGTTRERVLWHCLLHVVNHGTQHRSEAAAMLTAFGHSPGDLDFTLFLNSRK